jgi:hypothetical protein
MTDQNKSSEFANFSNMTNMNPMTYPSPYQMFYGFNLQNMQNMPNLNIQNVPNINMNLNNPSNTSHFHNMANLSSGTNLLGFNMPLIGPNLPQGGSTNFNNYFQNQNFNPVNFLQAGKRHRDVKDQFAYSELTSQGKFFNYN